MKLLNTLLFLFSFALNLTAQNSENRKFNLNLPSSSVKPHLEEVLKDYPNAFRNIQGVEICTYPGYTTYECAREIPGAVSASISRYATENGNVVSFEALMFSSENFNQAAAKYRSLFNDLSKGVIKMDRHRHYVLDGTFEKPFEEKKFFETSLRLLPADEVVDKLKLVITIEYVFPEWQVKIKLYDKEADDQIILGDEDDDM
ncbi:MAG TPA: hypothetical protein VIK74_09955 [Parasegetibacter sp.]|jgi:hypothetical protein